MVFQLVRVPRRTRYELAAFVAVSYRSAPVIRPSADVDVVPWMGVLAATGTATNASTDAIKAAAITAANDRVERRFVRILKVILLLRRFWVVRRCRCLSPETGHRRMRTAGPKWNPQHRVLITTVPQTDL